VVVTLGGSGAVLAEPDGTCRVAALPAAVVDVTGAGDALVAGTVAGLVRGEPLLEAVRRGIRLAGRTVGVAGSVHPGSSGWVTDEEESR
jgi:pseudouridine kinase